ncbi:MAG: exo-beta-N-acetylmuramidase NamZ domain-containing protein [Candidatus Korobacteraceae bacterium]
MGLSRYFRRSLPRGSAVLLILMGFLLPQAATQQLPSEGERASVTLQRFAAVDEVFRIAIEQKEIPGAVVVIGHNGTVVHRKAYGMRSVTPVREPMTVETIFDVASLTKVVATTPSVMRLVEQGRLRLNDPVAKYIPEFAANGKEQITVRQLLTHYSGLRAGLAGGENRQGRQAAYRLAHQESLVRPPGSHFLYSDINFIVLAELVERVSGQSLDQFAAQYIFKPLGMTHTSFTPPASWKSEIAPTAPNGRRMLRGTVHDPTARRMGGVGGHAGVFSTADDLARFAQAMLNGGGGALSSLTVEKMTTPQQPVSARELRGLGWDIDTPYSSPRGELFPVGSFGHTGFTGTSMWMDPVTRSYVILLTNAVHLGGGASMVSLRGRLATAVAAALDLTPDEQEQLRLARITGYNETLPASRRITVRAGKVRTGIDVLQDREFATLVSTKAGAKRKIGLVTNHTGLDSAGRRTIDVLASAPGIELAAIFSPEHGVLGQLDTTEVGNAVDPATGVTVYSVYGDTEAKRRPPIDVLKKLDAVVFDVQDAGARFYTYASTLGYFLEGAAEAGIEMVVLDRPNPITGSYVQGPLSDEGTQSFVNYHPVPVRHGMTLGELARMFNAERKINAKLTVVPMQGWQRGDWFDSTGLAWVSPSPNLRSLTAATLYPGVCMIEYANISVGRGTDTPFELVGAPWIKAEELADYLNRREIQGVRFVPVYFTPTASKYQGQRVGGVNIIVVDREFFDAPELGVELAAALHKLYPKQFDGKIEGLVNNRAVMQALASGVDPRRIADDWRDAVEEFGKRRKAFLLY